MFPLIVPFAAPQQWAEDRRTTFHFIRPSDLEVLVETFAELKEDGWHLPEWLALLHRTVRVTE